MRDWVYCRIKMLVMLGLFFAPVVVMQWHQRQLERMEQLNRMEPLVDFYAIVDEAELELP